MLKDEKGASFIELIISFTVILIVLLIFSNFFTLFNTQLRLNNLARSTIRIVEVEGGLTPQTLADVYNNIKKMGLDVSRVSIEGTPYPTQLRQPVYIKISYTVPFKVPVFNVSLGDVHLGALYRGSSEKFFK